MSKEMPLQFLPFASSVDTGFWHKFSQLKLDVLCLKEEAVSLTGYFSNSTACGMPALFNVDSASFERSPGDLACPGLLINTNTREAFKEFDKARLLQEHGRTILRAITDGTALETPCLLNPFLLVTFADLKKYDFFYWFGFPALKQPSSVAALEPPQQLSEALSAGQIAQLESAVSAAGSPPAFLLQLLPEVSVLPLQRLGSAPPAGELLLAFCDPSADPQHPGWPLRNLLVLYWHHWGRDRPDVRVLCWRDVTRGGARSVGHSLILKLRLSHEDGGGSDVPPPVTGWERNERGKMGPRLVNLSSSMEPTLLASSAVDLNLKLMRWRLVPELELERMTSARCLLLGAGTLGCNVARALLGWGVRHITLIDNGVVSYSNPVRQSLFTFEDSVQRRPKAVAAAARLRDIFPGVVSEGVELCVPMPGHPVGAAEVGQVAADVHRLRQLVTEHDLLFLLMDSRESRWLPTVMGAAHQKVVINAALGFDSYLVMRHGSRPPGAAPPATDGVDRRQLIPGHQLGCYFCNDVVAPGNSVHDRTLDQQCTVSRPGVSMVAAGLAVELAAALLQHPQRDGAPVSPRSDGAEAATAGPLGSVPHSVRGFLGPLQQLTPATLAFPRCTACSGPVLAKYREEGEEFLLKVFNRSGYLEDLTGLTELQQLTEATELWELDNDPDDF